MGHAIQALIIHDRAAAVARRETPLARLVSLAQGFSLLPLTDEVVEELGEDRIPAELPEGFTRLTDGVRRLASLLSEVAPVAYVETDYFGGVGTQASVAWSNARELAAPLSAESGVINEALRLIGVIAQDGRDEFDAVGLSRHRDNEAWLEDGQPA